MTNWKYFACVGDPIDPVAESASFDPEVTLTWVDHAIKSAETRHHAFRCIVFRVSCDMKSEAVARYEKPTGIGRKTKVTYYADAL